MDKHRLMPLIAAAGLVAIVLSGYYLGRHGSFDDQGATDFSSQTRVPHFVKSPAPTLP